VPMSQSKRMYDALKRAKKDVSFVRLDGEDHYLSKRTTRIKTLRAVAEFVEGNL
jgi:dipeptidyl aminopeptidase/acylaminoacyl peptidase